MNEEPTNRANETADRPASGLAKLNRILSVVLQWAAIVIMSLLVLDVVWGVVTRYALGEQAKWTEEMARFLLIWVSLLGGAIAYRNREHLGIDFVVTKLEPGVLGGTRLFTEVLSCLIVFIVMIVGGIQLVWDALYLEQTTPALEWKMGYIYLVVPVVGVMMLLFSIEYIASTWRSGPESRSTAEEPTT